MQTYWKGSLALAIATTLTLGAQTASAALISIDNYSFEDPMYGDGAFSNLAPGWVVSGDSGTWNPTVFQMSQGPTDGSNVGFSNGGSLSQTLSDVLTAGTEYTLMVDVLSRTDGYLHLSSTLQLWTEDDILLASASLGGLAAGVTELLTTTYIATAGDPNLGKNLKIVLVSGGVQSDWDNVRLDAAPSAVPLPASIWLLGSGLLGLVGMKRKANASV